MTVEWPQELREHAVSSYVQVVNRAVAEIKQLQTELADAKARIEGLEAAVIWSKKFDTITVKDLREFLQVLKGR